MQEVSAGSPASPASVSVEAGPSTGALTIAIPQSLPAMEGLRTRRQELVSQLNQAQIRRTGILGEIGTSSRRERDGLEQRLQEIDQRILQIETDIAATDRALAHAPPAVLGAAQEAAEAEDLARELGDYPIDGDVIAIMGFMGMCMMVPIAFAYVSRLWRRRKPARALSVAAEGRLERIEHAIDAIAIEVERVSDGQRFVTGLLSESKKLPQPETARMQRAAGGERAG